MAIYITPIFSGFQVALKFLKKTLIFLGLAKITKKTLKKGQIPKKALIFQNYPNFFVHFRSLPRKICK